MPCRWLALFRITPIKRNLMKQYSLLIILILGISCAEKTRTPSEQITTYYQGFKNSDYTLVKSTLSDSLINISGDYRMPYSQESYYEKFKWDSVFKPEYELVSIERKAEHPIATVTMNSPKLEFLQNNPMTCRYAIYFENDKIAKIQELDCPTANWVLWAKQRDSLVAWTKVNHPELDGFINDLTMQGAMNYMQAIELFNNK